jgi:hypothetical protein
MANGLTPLGMVTKWLIVPVALMAIGYLFVGPRVESKMPELKERVLGTGAERKNKEAEPDPAKTASATPISNSKFTAPEVDVSVTALNNRQDPPKRKRRKRKKSAPKTTVVPDAPPVAPPPAPLDGN